MDNLAHAVHTVYSLRLDRALPPRVALLSAEWGKDQLTRNTLLAAVRLSPTAPDLSEMSMTRGESASAL